MTTKMTAQIAKDRLLTEKILANANRLQKPCPIRSSILAALDCGDIERARQLSEIAEPVHAAKELEEINALKGKKQ